MQEIWVRPLIQGDPTYCGVTKPLWHNYLSLRSRNQDLQLLKATCPGAHAPQEKPPQWEACTQQQESSSHSLQVEKSPYSNKDLGPPKTRLLKKNKGKRGALCCPRRKGVWVISQKSNNQHTTHVFLKIFWCGPFLKSLLNLLQHSLFYVLVF